MPTNRDETQALLIEQPNYVAPTSLEEQLARDDREARDASSAGYRRQFSVPGTSTPPTSAQLTGAGTFIDNGWDRWHYIVDEENGIPGQIVIQLQVSQIITWWKRIEIQALIFGRIWWNIRTLGTSNDTRVATTDITPAAARSDVLQLEFWKAGFLNSGSYLHTEAINVQEHLGKMIVFICDRDHPSQP